MANLNRISFRNTRKVATWYRRWKWYSKLTLWAAVIAIPSVFFFTEGKVEQASTLAMGLALFSVSVHALLTYTKYLAFIVPNIAHIMAMPIAFGYYWASPRMSTTEIANMTVANIYIQGAFFGIIYTFILVPLVLKFTRGRLWLTFTLIYACVDFLGIFWSMSAPNMGLWIPAIITSVLLFLRSEFLHKLVYRKERYVIPEDNIFTRNSHAKAEKSAEDSLEEHGFTTVPLHNEFFDFLVLTGHRVFAVYSLKLPKRLRVTQDEDNNVNLSYDGHNLNQEIGLIGSKAAKLSKKWRLKAQDVTPVVLCDGALPKDKGFVGVTVSRKGAQLNGSDIFSGIVYFLDVNNVKMLNKAWSTHSLSKYTKKTMHKTFKLTKSEDSKDEKRNENVESDEASHADVAGESSTS